MCTVRKKKVDFSKEAIQRAYSLPEYVDQVFEHNHFVMHNREPYPQAMFFKTIMCTREGGGVVNQGP